MTFYDAKYCRMLMDHCENGKSLESFCASIRVSPKIISEWYNDYSDFKEAVDMAPCLELLHWEQAMIRAISNKDKELLGIAKLKVQHLSGYVISPLKKNTYVDLKEVNLNKSVAGTGDYVKDMDLLIERRRNGSRRV